MRERKRERERERERESELCGWFWREERNGKNGRIERKDTFLSAAETFYYFTHPCAHLPPNLQGLSQPLLLIP